jgi:hydrogenase/urease accessory protein HupE
LIAAPVRLRDRREGVPIATARAVVGGAALLLRPGDAEAHLVTTGLGPIYDGPLHFVVSPDDLVPVLALALLAGLRGPAHGRRALLVLPAAWLLAGAFGLAMVDTASVGVTSASVVTSLSFVLLGALVAADARLSPGAVTVLAAWLGLVHGYTNGITMAQPSLGPTALLGITAAVFAFVAIAASAVVPVRAVWARVGVRVAGSWVAAIGLLLLGWTFRVGRTNAPLP